MAVALSLWQLSWQPDSLPWQVMLCLAMCQLYLLLFAWVGQILTLIATKLDMWFTRQYKEERIDLLLSRISSVGADVVCLQEAIPMVWCSEYMERYVAAANAPIALSSIHWHVHLIYRG